MPDHLKDRLDWLISTYFSSTERTKVFQPGDAVMYQGKFNNRLYYIKRGSLTGLLAHEENGQEIIEFMATAGSFVGVYSFFSLSYQSLTTIIANEETEVCYIEPNQPAIKDDKNQTLFEQFMPVVVVDLIERQKRQQQIAIEKEEALMKLIDSEKYAVLGQLAAVIAHELNNSISVIERNTDWVSKKIADYLTTSHPEFIPFFHSGQAEKVPISGYQIKKKLEPYLKAGLTESNAIKAATLNIPTEGLRTIIGTSREQWIEAAFAFYEMGTTLHDLLIAARHSQHVVQSVKTLGSPKSEKVSGLSINKSIQEAATLLSSPLRKVEVNYQLGELPTVYGSDGEWIQVWVNLLKNAVESLLQSQSRSPLIQIRSYQKENYLVVDIEDNGPGIPADIQDRIFQPRVTSKTNNNSTESGMGLGLTIVSRILDSYNSQIFVCSEPGQTIFTVKIPLGG